MPNSFSNSTVGAAFNRGLRKSESATPLTLADLQSMDLEDLAALRLDEMEGSSWRFSNGFNQKQPQTVSRS